MRLCVGCFKKKAKIRVRTSEPIYCANCAEVLLEDRMRQIDDQREELLENADEIEYLRARVAELEAATYQPDWHPILDVQDVPPLHEGVLVTGRFHGVAKAFLHHDRCDKLYWAIGADRPAYEEVIAWAPLPPAYKPADA